MLLEPPGAGAWLFTQRTLLPSFPGQHLCSAEMGVGGGRRGLLSVWSHHGPECLPPSLLVAEVVDWMQTGSVLKK